MFLVQENSFSSVGAMLNIFWVILSYIYIWMKLQYIPCLVNVLMYLPKHIKKVFVCMCKSVSYHWMCSNILDIRNETYTSYVSLMITDISYNMLHNVMYTQVYTCTHTHSHIKCTGADHNIYTYTHSHLLVLPLSGTHTCTSAASQID